MANAGQHATTMFSRISACDRSVASDYPAVVAELRAIAASVQNSSINVSSSASGRQSVEEMTDPGIEWAVPVMQSPAAADSRMLQMSALPLKADVDRARRVVRFVPIADNAEHTPMLRQRCPRVPKLKTPTFIRQGSLRSPACCAPCLHAGAQTGLSMDKVAGRAWLNT